MPPNPPQYSCLQCFTVPPGVSTLVAGIYAARYWESEYPDDSSFTSRGGLAYFIRFALDLATLHWHRGIDFSPDEIRYLRKLTNGNTDRGVIHELSTTRYFINKGAEVDPRFLLIASREELIVRWGNDEFHVQCKSKPPGAGRTIDPELVQRLTAGIGVDASRRGRSPEVEIETTGRMQLADVEVIRSAVYDAPMNSGPLLVTSGTRTFAVKVTEIQARPQTREQSFEWLGSFDARLSHAVVGFDSEGNYKPAVAVTVNSAAEENPWQGLRKSISRAEHQLEGHRNGIAAIHYSDYYPSFESLRPGEIALKNLRPDLPASEPLRPGEDRMSVAIAMLLSNKPHMAGVMISCDPQYVSDYQRQPGNVIIYGIETRLPDGWRNA